MNSSSENATEIGILNNNGSLNRPQDEICLSRYSSSFSSSLSLSSSSSSSSDSNETTVSPAGVLVDKFCGAVWDGFNCWGPANAGSTVYLACPASKGMDLTKQSYRTCGITGQWLNRDGVPDVRGWTNYTPCFTPEILALIKRLYSGSATEAMYKIEIARSTRILEIFGLSVSFAALLLSLFVFYYFRSLRNPRTRLHRHLFVAMVIQVTVRLTLYIDQFIVRSNSLSEKSVGEQQQYAKGIDNTPFLCEAAYICLEYARTSMYMWMFVEGLYLHNMITVTVFEEKLSPSIYPLVGWVFPIPLTLSWAVMTATHYGTATCWWGYNFTLYYWIIEGPRLGVLIVNLAFLLNILRVLVTKLRQSNSSEAHQARKAVKAAFVLLPLLGLTNLLNMLDAPLERSAVEFGLWSYTTHTLTSFQGFILSCLYCFWNGEVQMALKKFVRYKILNNRQGRGAYKSRGRGSIRMSLMNNNSGANNVGNVTLLGGQPNQIHILNPTNSAMNTTPTLIRLSPVPNNRVNNKDVEITQEKQQNTYVAENNLNLHVEEDDADSVTVQGVIEKGELGELVQKEKSRNIVNHNKTTSTSHNNGSKVRRLSKLKIWISPIVVVNEKSRKSRNKHGKGKSKTKNSHSEVSSVRYVQEMKVRDIQEEEDDEDDDDEDNDNDENVKVGRELKINSIKTNLDEKERKQRDKTKETEIKIEEEGEDEDDDDVEKEEEGSSFSDDTPTTNRCSFHIEMLQDLQ